MAITIPHNFEPRTYQLPLLRAMDNGYKRAVCVWHRRAGKDKTLINLVTKKAYERIGSYYYYFPTGKQARRTIWDGMDKAGFPFIKHLPKEIISRKNDQEMKVVFRNGSIFQLLGTDRTEVVGPNPVGCVFSEYSLQNPQAWNYVRPILAENEGWAVFNSTPRGMNHLHQLYAMAQDNENWFSELLTVDDTSAIKAEAIEEEKRAGMSDELVKQEFYCSFEYGLEGAYYLKSLSRARKEGRICELPILDSPVHTAMDLGVGDATAIWFWQKDGNFYNLIDYYENQGEGLAHYVSVMKQKGYEYGDHFAPHDADKRGAFTATTLADRARKELGLKLRILPRESNIDNGIEAVRAIFPRCRFDKNRCADGINAVNNYQKEYDDKKQVFRNYPMHNWASHGSDALRYFARAVGHFQAKDDIKIDKSKWTMQALPASQGWMA